MSRAEVNAEDVCVVADFGEAFVEAMSAGDLSAAVTAARTVQASISEVLEVLDPEGVCSPGITHSNGVYVGTRFLVGDEQWMLLGPPRSGKTSTDEELAEGCRWVRWTNRCGPGGGVTDGQ